MLIYYHNWAYNQAFDPNILSSSRVGLYVLLIDNGFVLQVSCFSKIVTVTDRTPCVLSGSTVTQWPKKE